MRCCGVSSPPELIDTFVRLKRSEIERHRAWVSDWEVAEYLRHL